MECKSSKDDTSLYFWAKCQGTKSIILLIKFPSKYVSNAESRSLENLGNGDSPVAGMEASLSYRLHRKYGIRLDRL